MTRLGTFTQISPNAWRFQDYGDVIQAIENAERYRERNGTLAHAETCIEEFVRQWVLQRLIEGYGYPVEWIESQRLVIEQFIPFGSRRNYGQADIALLHPTGRPFILIEIKTLGISETAFVDAVGQLESYLSATHSASIGMVTDGLRTVVLCKQFDPPDFVVIEDLPTFEEALREQWTYPDDTPDVLSDAEVTQVDTDEEGGDEQEDDGTIYIPTVEEYIEAFQLIDAHITDLQRALLRAHYQAPDHTATATELAHAVGASSFRTTNAQYGRLAAKLIDVLHWPHKGQVVHLTILAEFVSPKFTQERQWLLIMLPEVAEAIERLKWV
ncbi:MAG: hypothetical protein OHK0022_31100 [Roseiflexaceae bacterium]